MYPSLSKKQDVPWVLLTMRHCIMLFKLAPTTLGSIDKIRTGTMTKTRREKEVVIHRYWHE